MKYLGIIIDNKFKFSEHIRYAAERCTKLIHSLSKSQKYHGGWNKVLKTISKGAILPHLLYGAPIWIEAFKFDYNKLKYIRVQSLMNIWAKAFHTKSKEALCILAGTTPIIIKIEEVVKQYNITKGKGSQTQLIDSELELKNWPHPADAVKIIEAKGYQDKTIQAYTDGVQERAWGWIWSGNIGWKGTCSTTKIQTGQQMFKQPGRTTSYFQAHEVIETTEIAENSARTATIFTDSRISKTH